MVLIKMFCSRVAVFFFFACLQSEKMLSPSNGRTNELWKEEQTKNENIILYSIVLVVNK